MKDTALIVGLVLLVGALAGIVLWPGVLPWLLLIPALGLVALGLYEGPDDPDPPSSWSG